MSGVQVGAQPKGEAIAVWLQRMREQGWDVSDLVARAVSCGARLKPEACAQSPVGISCPQCAACSGP